MTKRVYVAVGVIINSNGEYLIAKRPDHLHQGGKWEFPGGKVEQGETVTQALIRELDEEVNIHVVQTVPFMELSFDYPDKQVLLDIHQVCEFSGEAKGLEGQQILWVSKAQLSEFDFPAANQAILNKLIEQDE